MTPVLAAKIEHWPIGRLIPYARNARTHSPAQVEQIARSIQTFGFTNPILVDGAQGILAGHGRLQAAQRLKLAVVPVIVLDHLSEAERRAYILADNKLAENAGWDDGMLAAELAAVRDMDFGLDVIGFDEKELAKLLGVPDDAAADECPDVPERAVTAAGDLWLLGRHRLLCGDATRREDVERVMAGARADMVFTDPPYGANYSGQTATMFYGDGKKGKPRAKIAGDVTIDDAAALTMAALSTHLAPIAFVWHAPQYGDAIRAAVSGAGYDPFTVICWNKNVANFGAIGAHYKPKYELALACRIHGQVIPWYGPDNETTVWDVARAASNEFHPTQKPVILGERAIGNHTLPDASVLDFFAGSGSTLIACEKTERVARLLEIDRRYCDVIVKRWQTYAGGRATRERDGRTFDECAADELEIPLNCTAGQVMLGARDLIAEEAFAEE